MPRWIFWLGVSVGAAWLLYALRGVLAPVFFAFLIAYMLDPLVDRIAAGRGEELEAREITQFEEQYQIFLGMALLLLMADLLLSDRKRVQAAWAGRFE